MFAACGPEGVTIYSRCYRLERPQLRALVRVHQYSFKCHRADMTWSFTTNCCKIASYEFTTTREIYNGLYIHLQNVQLPYSLHNVSRQLPRREVLACRELQAFTHIPTIIVNHKHRPVTSQSQPQRALRRFVVVISISG